MSVLVVGGAGYIGSHTVSYLLSQKEEVVIVDNLSTGYKEFVLSTKFYQCDIRDFHTMEQIFRDNNFEAVIHFAANSIVPESMKKPLEYYQNNVYGMLCLLEVMKNHNVKKLVFSSSAAVYGEPKRIPIKEDDITLPTNPYGETKLAIEKIMNWCEIAYGIQYVSLRYFNAAGALENSFLQEKHYPETHLIPLVLQAAFGKKEFISVFGNDYPTKDGSCVRDYIHVMDLASAHYLSLKFLRNNKKSEIFNLGNKKGISVLEIIDCCRSITNKRILTKIENRRPGDPAILIASNEKAKNILHWEPCFSSIDKIVLDAWNSFKN